MLLSASRLAVSVPFVLVALVPFLACDDTTPSGSGATVDAAASGDTGSSTSQDGAPSEDAEPTGTCANPVNGIVAAQSGTFNHHVTNNVEANLGAPQLTGTIPCEGQFSPNGGVSLGNGAMSGSFSITCWGAAGDDYYGVRMTGMGKPVTGSDFPIGHAASVSQGDGGYAPNGQADLAWEAGPRCGTKQNKSREWNGEALAGAGGALHFDTVTGQDTTFHLYLSNLKLSTTGLNYTGKGTFSLDGTGSITLTGL